MLCNTPKRYLRRTTLALGSWFNSLKTEKKMQDIFKLFKARHFIKNLYKEATLAFHGLPMQNKNTVRMCKNFS